MYTDYFENEPPAGRAIVRSSFGELLVDTETGRPVELRCEETHGSPWILMVGEGEAMSSSDLCPAEDNFLKDIIRFDFDEWKRHWRQDLHPVFDILDLGFWMKDETYQEPESTWRDDRRHCVGLGRV